MGRPSRLAPGIITILLLLACSASGTAQEASPAPRPVWVLGGTVRDATTRQPVANARVAVPLPGGDRIARSDSLGRYRVQAAYDRGPAVPVTVRVFAPGFLPESTAGDLGCPSVSAPAGEAAVCRRTLDFELRAMDPLFEPSDASCTLRGSVLRDGGTPLGDAQISLVGEPHRALSDHDGRFSLADVPAGMHLVVASMIGYFPAEQLALVACSPSRALAPVQLRLMPSAIY